MPNWEQIVAERLERLNLAPEERREVIAELAAHLEECHSELRNAGSPDPEGYTLAQVRDWKALCRRIQKSKEGPMSFTRRVVMPGLVTLFLAQFAQWVVLHSLPRSGPVLITPGAFYLFWLPTLPVFGACGAWLARQAGARPGERLTAALFPSIFNVVASTVFGVVAFLTDPGKLIADFRLDHEVSKLLFSVVIPGIACHLGAWPFLSKKSRQAEHTPPTDAAHA